MLECVSLCMNVCWEIDLRLSSRSRSSRFERREERRVSLELFVFHKEYVNVELTLCQLLSLPWMIRFFSLSFLLLCRERDRTLRSWRTPRPRFSVLLEKSQSLINVYSITDLSYFFYFNRRKEPPVSEREPANLTRRAVDADVDPSTSKRAFARPVVILPKRCVDTIGEQKLRDVEPTEPDAWNTWRQCLADSKTDSERVRRLRRFPRTKFNHFN